MSALPPWVEYLTAALLLAGSLLALCGAIGLLRLKDFFQRMHAPALASTLGTWCVAGAWLVYFSALSGTPALHVWLIPILLAITVPVTTLLLARAALFRRRAAGEELPAELSAQIALNQAGEKQVNQRTDG